MVFRRLSTLCLIFMGDAIYALAKCDNMYTLKHTGAAGMFANVASLIIATWLFAASPRGRRLRGWLARRVTP